MNYSKINKYDVSNGLGVRTSIFFCGCGGFDGKHCEGCFNKEIWDFNSGTKFDENTKKVLFTYLSDNNVKGLSVLGGEPLQQGKELAELLMDVKYTFPLKDIWLWTGYNLLDVLSSDNTIQKNILYYCDFVVDGKFEINEKDPSLAFRGSRNQIIWEKNKENGQFFKSNLN